MRRERRPGMGEWALILAVVLTACLVWAMVGPAGSGEKVAGAEWWPPE